MTSHYIGRTEEGQKICDQADSGAAWMVLVLVVLPLLVTYVLLPLLHRLELLLLHLHIWLH
jgi:hypothetical protein